jgi:hypothetical protein
MVFVVIFLFLACFHFYLSTQAAPDFILPARPGSESGSVVILGADVDQPLRNFAASFNGYVHEQNRNSELGNMLAAFGYLLCALTAGISFYLERRESGGEKLTTSPSR